MKYKLYITEMAENDLRNMEKPIAKRIGDKLKYFISTPNPMLYAKPLTGPMKGLFRFRIGKYRAIFEKDAKGVLTVLIILINTGRMCMNDEIKKH